MPRSIPVATQQALSKPASTMTRVLKIMLKSGTVYGLCMTNKDVLYDDGSGLVNYVATNGFDPSAFSADASYSVDNAEGYALISNDIPGITVEMVAAGELDDARWICYYVDYESPVPKSAVLLDAGDVGEVKVDHGLIFTPELLSYMMRLKQPVGGIWSRTCRAVFGSPANSQTGCGVNAEALWQNFTVTAVGNETDRQFTVSGPAGNFNPGRVRFSTGKNAGPIFATENVAGNSVMLSETTPYDIQVGDTGRIRPDCDKTATMCKFYNNYPNMKAEDSIPVSDAAAISVPGAQT
jgi:uncharacterized phage protein (TIGR02218 family)